MGVKFAYVGIDGAYLNGIPARDISDAEYDQLSDDAKQLLATNVQSDNALYRAFQGDDDAPVVPRRTRRNMVDVDTPAPAPVETTLLGEPVASE